MESTRPRRKCARYTPDEPSAKRVASSLSSPQLGRRQTDLLEIVYGDYFLKNRSHTPPRMSLCSRALELYPERFPDAHLLIYGRRIDGYSPLLIEYAEQDLKILMLSFCDAERYRQKLPNRILSLALDHMQVTRNTCIRIKRLGIETNELRCGSEFYMYYNGPEMDDLCEGITRLHWMGVYFTHPPHNWINPVIPLELLQLRDRYQLVGHMPINSRVVDLRYASIGAAFGINDVAKITHAEEIRLTDSVISDNIWDGCGYKDTSVSGDCPLVRISIDNYSIHQGTRTYHPCTLHKRIASAAKHRRHCDIPDGSTRIPVQLELPEGYTPKPLPPLTDCPHYPVMLKEFTKLLTEVLPSQFELGLIPEIVSWSGLPPEPLLPNGEKTFLLS